MNGCLFSSVKHRKLLIHTSLKGGKKGVKKYFAVTSEIHDTDFNCLIALFALCFESDYSFEMVFL